MMNSCFFIVMFVLHLCSLCTAIVCITSERDTLLNFKHSLSDPFHRLSSWNSTSNPNCCLWHGVVCSNVTSHVVRLHLGTSPPNVDDYTFDGYHFDVEAYEKALEAYNRIRFGGEINPCLVDLKHLKYLDLSGNHFGSVLVPSFIGRMSSLTHLNLSHAAFMGNIPSHIANLSNLLQLDLRSNDLVAENLDWLSSLSKLQYLDLSFNKFSGMPIPSFIGKMSSLSHLDLYEAGFVGDIPYQIGNLFNLVYLKLGSYFDETLFAENVDWLSNLSKLEYLDLSHANLSKSNDWLQTLQALPSLKHLDLSYCTLPDHYNEPSLLNFSSLLTLDLSFISYSAATSSVPKWIFGLKKLVSLQLRRNQIQGPIPDGIQNLTLLQNLDLSDNSFSSSISDWLYSLHHLRFLNLGINKLHGSISDALGNLTSLVRLDLSTNQLGGTIPTSLGNLISLVELHLSSNQLRGTIPTSLGNLISLVKLDLSGNQLGGTIPTSLGNLISLVKLDLSGNQLGGTIPTSLGNLISLVELHLSSNQLAGIIPTSLKNLISLVELDLSSNQLGGTIPTSLANLISLVELVLSSNQLGGTIPTSLANLISLVKLDLSRNQLGGTIPTSWGNLTNGFGKLSSLSDLYLSQNQFTGNPFVSLRLLSNMSYLDIQDNHFQGVVKEDDLANLRSLNILYASGNNLVLKVGPNWVPTFQLSTLYMSSWQLGPNFPSWIRSQNELQDLEMSNTGILDSIPSWFWEAFSQAYYLNLSHNHIHGELATTLKHPISISTVDLSTNNLCGKLPYLSNEVSRLDISGNSLSESMGDFLCKQQGTPMQLEILNLASNNLSGEIPDCWMIWPYLIDVNLQSNHLAGNLPPSMGSLVELQSLQMRNNSLSGIFPTIFKKTNKLVSLDLGENKFSGAIPGWVGQRLLSIKVLRLRSNRFLGHIPDTICNMSLLQILDLAQNNLSGNIPTCFNRLNAMTLMNKSTIPFIYCLAVNYTAISIVSELLWLKGRGDEYKNILGLVTSIDLSNNKLVGEIPREITDLNGLTFLNLSQNQLKGHIPQSIGNMGWLLSIDFSRNQLSGEIPPTITNLSFLSMLDLSNNHLKGKIPTGAQLQTFEAFNFIGNYLCGAPLPINCSSSGKIDSYNHKGKGSGRHGVNWFFVSMTFGFIVGFWMVIAPLFIWRSWRYAYFCFLDHVWFKLQSLF